MREWNGFADGSRYHEVFDTPDGFLLLEASLHLEAQTVVLRDVLVEPLDTQRLFIGSGLLLRLWRTVLESAKVQGSTHVALEGVRTSGANPYHAVRIRRRV